MSDLKTAIERDMNEAGLPATTFDDLSGRRDRRRRNQRISAGVVGAAVFAAFAAWIGTSVLLSDGATTPAPGDRSVSPIRPLTGNGPMTWAADDVILMEGEDPAAPIVLASDVADQGWEIESIDWSPDGRRIAITTVKRPPRSLVQCRLLVLDVDTGSLTDLANCMHPSWGRQTADWSPDGRSIVFAGPGGIHVIGADGSNPVRLTADGGSDPSWSLEGRIAYATSDHTRIVSMASDGSDAIVLISRGSGAHGISSPAWSPDATRIAYLHAEDLPGDPAGAALGTGLWIADADGSNAVKVATMECCLFATQAFGWSPDGSKLLWTGTEIIIIKADGSEERRFRHGGSVGLPRLDMSVPPSWRPVARPASS